MLTAARIREDLADVDGLRWITTLRAPTIRKLVAAGTVTPSLFDDRDLAEVTSEEFPGERLIVCRNPLLAAERQRKRHELLAATEKELEPIVAATRRRNNPLRGAADIGMRVGKVINRYKVAKHFVTTITDESFTFRRDEDQIADERQLDGLYIVRSNVEPEQFDAAQTVRAYKDLSKVERAFRSLKTADLKVRPTHHRRADRVRAHVFVCMLAYYVEWHNAPGPQAAPVRRPRPGRCRTTARLGGPEGQALARGTRQGRRKAHRRRPARAQLPNPARRPRHPDRQHHAGGRRRRHLHDAHQADTGSATQLRAAGSQPANVASTQHHRNLELQ